MEQQIHITLRFHLATGKVNLNEVVYRLQELKNSLILSVLEKILHLRIWKGRHDASGRSVFPFEEPKLLNKLKYNFDLNKAGEYGWKELAGKKRFYPSKRLIEKSIDMLFSKIHDDIIKQ